MSEKFLNKYRIQSARLQFWDYGNDGAYFITLCTNDREHYFGKISGGTMILNGAGKLAERFWNEIQNHFPFTELDRFVIMPNHVHGILIINREVAYRYDNITWNGIDTGSGNGYGDTMGNGNDTGGPNGDGDTTGNGNTMKNVIEIGNVETRLIASLQKQSPGIPQSQPEKPGGFAGNKNPMFHRNISRIIRWYKGRCSFEINKIHPVFAWQPRFYEHIIRDAAEWDRIRKYITNNPANWKEGKSN